MKTTKNEKAEVLRIIHLRDIFFFIIINIFFYLSIFFKKQSRTYSLEIYTDRNN